MHPSRGLILLPVFCTGGCMPWVLDPAGRIGAQERIILLDSLAIMLAIVVPTILATLGLAWWYRAGNVRARHLPEFTYSGRLELLVWSIPALVILFLGGIIWVSSHQLDPAKPIPGAPLEVDVVAMDWKWLFLYPQDGIASVNRLVVPVGQPVHFRVTSASVFNSFFIPRIGSQIYAMPGMVADLNLSADQAGRYHGLSAQFSGDGFSNMGFDVDAVPSGEFSAWAAQARRGSALDSQAYGRLRRPSQNVPPQTWRLAQQGLFSDIVMGASPGGKTTSGPGRMGEH